MNHNGRKLFHSTVRIAGSKTVYVDPWQIDENPQDADLILVTHEHHDHYSPEDIQKLSKPGTVLVAPASIADQVPEGTKLVQPGEKYCFCGIPVETVAAYNIGRPFHSQARNYVGYVVTMDGIRYFIAGDTDKIPENETVSCDVAFVPCGGKYTMDANQAAQLVNCIRPKVAVPTHYGTVTDSSDAAVLFQAAVDPEIAVEIHE